MPSAVAPTRRANDTLNLRCTTLVKRTKYDMNKNNTFALRARWVFPIERPPVPNGIVTIAQGRIVAIGQNTSGQPPLNLGNVALLPGLINTHTHLEFSELPEPLGRAGCSFVEWVAAVIAERRGRESAVDSAEPWQAAAVEQGLKECARYGTVAVGEIATAAAVTESCGASSLDCTVFRELLGLDPSRIDPLMTLAREHVAAAQSEAAVWRAGLSPHAPYSVHPSLLPQLCQLSRETGVPVAMHLAETREELELLDTGGGDFVPLLQWLDAWHPDAIPRGTKPMDYLQVLAQADRALIIHGNYLNDDEHKFLAEHNERMSVVYCPRTHAYFRHLHYPLARMLAAGVNVALGTDSRASNPDLNLFAEMRSIYRRHPHVAPADVLRLGTINGAKSLGLQDHFGSIMVGKRADFASIGLPNVVDDDPFDLLFGSPFPVQRLCFAGSNT